MVISWMWSMRSLKQIGNISHIQSLRYVLNHPEPPKVVPFTHHLRVSHQDIDDEGYIHKLGMC